MARGRAKKTKAEEATVETEVQETTVEPTEEITETTEETQVEETTVETPAEPVEEVKEETPVAPTEEEKKPVAKAATVREALKGIKNITELHEALKDDKEVGHLVTALKRYADTAYGPRATDPNAVAAINYELYKLINGVLNEDNYNVFKTKFDVINKIFTVESKGKFNALSLSRYDHYWTYGVESKMNYVVLVELLSIMSNPGDRAKNKTKFTPDSLGKHVSGKAVQNLVKYYNL